jgi:hypothetical protein
MPKIEPQRIRIRGQYWLLLSKVMRKLDGIVSHPKDSQKELWIRRSLVGFELLESLIHEMLHAAFPDVTEAVIDEVAHDISTVLWELGYSADWDDEHVCRVKKKTPEPNATWQDVTK